MRKQCALRVHDNAIFWRTANQSAILGKQIPKCGRETDAFRRSQLETLNQLGKHLI